MSTAALTPSSIDWRFTLSVGIATLLAALFLLFRYREQLLLFAIGAALLEVGLLIATRGLLRPLAGNIGWLGSFLLIAPAALAGVALLRWRGWWYSAGLTPPSRWRQHRLLWLLALPPLLASLSLVRGIHLSTEALLVLTAYTILATATEELFYRGIVLRAAIGYGVVPAVLISAVLFGASHVNGLFASYAIDPLFVLYQAWFGVLLGVFFAAVRLRINAIWPTMAAHAAYDLPGILVYGIYAFTVRPSASSFVIVTGFGLFLAAIGLLLVRGASPAIIATDLRP